MKKQLILPLLALTAVMISGCTDNEDSIPSDDLYSTVSERNMPQYCKQKVANEYGIYAGDIYLYPVVYERGAKVIRGRYSVDSTHLKEFACIFNNNDTYAGIKMLHSNVKNKLCYGE